MSCPFKHLHADFGSPTSVSSTPSRKSYDGGTVNNIIMFMQSSPDAAFLLDQRGKIVYRNKAAQLMFVTNLNQMGLCSIFTFASSTSWDDLAKNLTSEPQHHDANITESDGTHLAFRLNLVRLPPEIMGEANSDVFACAYVTPAHDHEYSSGVPRYRDRIPSIAEEGTLTLNDEHLQKHMKDVVSASLDPMVSLNEDGKIAVANDPAVHLFGYSHDELVGKDIASICPMAREVQNILDFMHAPSINKQQITTATNKDGKELSIELGLSLNQSFAGSTKPVYFAHMKDLTALKEHKEQIEHKDNLCQALINSSFDAMFSIDQRGKIIFVNDAACQAFQYSREEFMGANISMICNEKDAPYHDKHLRRYIRTGQKRVIGRKRPLVARRKDGTEFHIELGVSEVALPDGEKMFCGYVRDRTQERLDKQMLRRKEAVIQDKFFQMEPGDARAGLRKYSSGDRFTQ